MTLFITLTAATLITWAARATFIALLPADLLPARLTSAFATSTPAVLAALTVASVVKLRAEAGGVLGLVLPLAVAALLARINGNLAIVVLGALLAGTGARLVGW